MLKNIMKKRILIMLLWGFPLCFCGGAEFPEHSFAPSGNEHFAVDDYGSELVESRENSVSTDWIEDIGAIMGMTLMGIAYGIFAYRVRRQ